MILIFTDYGFEGPYLGNIHAELALAAPSHPVVNLMSDAPSYNPRYSAYLLSAFTSIYPRDTVIFAVIDPGVGSGMDKPVFINADGRWYVGPDNGLFDLIFRTAREVECHEILWRPANVSSTFHGRDIYAPVCAMLANGNIPESRPISMERRISLPDDLFEIIYCDHFGNLMTGIRGSAVPGTSVLLCGGHAFRSGSYFAEVPPGEYFWHENSYGLVELSVNQGNASRVLGIVPGDGVSINQRSQGI